MDRFLKWQYLLFFILILLVSLVVSSLADDSWENSEGILLSSQAYEPEQYDELITVTDIAALLDRTAGRPLFNGMSLLFYEAKPGAVLSPDAVLPVPEVIYITRGSARVKADDDEIIATADDVVYIPSQKIRMIENAENETLGFFSIIDWSSASEDGNQTESNTTNMTFGEENPLQIRNEESTPVQVFGNQSTNEVFSFYRLIHPAEESFIVPYDLGTVHIPVNVTIPDHYIDGRFQLMHVLSGSGTISVGCHEYQVQPGDVMYVAPGAVMNVSAPDDIHMMVITNPFYQAAYDHAIPFACDIL